MTKINDFLAAGSSLFWVIEPRNQIVQVYRRGQTGIRLSPGDFLDGENVLPGFRCEVAQLFA